MLTVGLIIYSWMDFCLNAWIKCRMIEGWLDDRIVGGLFDRWIAG